MIKRIESLNSIANTISDYRAGELPRPTAEHVDRWVKQFDKSVQLPILRELDHVLKHTYFARAAVGQFFSEQISHKQLAREQPHYYWQKAHFLEIQQHGSSQVEIRQLFGEALKAQCGLDIDNCGAIGGDYFYLDDVLFTGGRIGADLSSWITNTAPNQGTVHILVIAAHRFGEWKCAERLKEDAKNAGKDLVFNCWAALWVENRRKHRAASEVLWPAAIPDDAALRAYLAEEQKFPFELREPGGRPEHPIFSSEDGRQLLEREFLLAGMRIRSFSQNPNKALRPLGFSPFGLGFGSMIVTYRNCPNNVPLALWWGDSKMGAGHPFSKWYPLLPRKTYTQQGQPQFGEDEEAIA